MGRWADRVSSAVLACRLGWVGEVVVTYMIEEGSGVRHLVVSIWFGRVGRLAPRLRRLLLVWGDVVMMDHQLRTICRLAEATTPAH